MYLLYSFYQGRNISSAVFPFEEYGHFISMTQVPQHGHVTVQSGYAPMYGFVFSCCVAIVPSYWLVP
jgi:hypothetical protein